MDKRSGKVSYIPDSPKLLFGGLLGLICFLIFCLTEIKGKENTGIVISIEKKVALGLKVSASSLEIKLDNGYIVYADSDTKVRVGDKIEFIGTNLILSNHIKYKFVKKM